MSDFTVVVRLPPWAKNWETAIQPATRYFVANSLLAQLKINIQLDNHAGKTFFSPNRGRKTSCWKRNPFCAKLSVQFMDVKLPKLGEGADSGVVVGIFVKEGDTVAKDQPILELENEKAVASIPSTAAGVVQKVHVKSGDRVSVGQRLLTLAGDGSAAPAAESVAKPPAKRAAAGRRNRRRSRSRSRTRTSRIRAGRIRRRWLRRWRRRHCAGWRGNLALI